MYSDAILGVQAFGTLSAPSVASTGVVAFRYIALKPIKVKRVAAAISTVMSSTGTIVIAVTRRPTIGSSSGEVAIATITIPATQAAATIVYKNVASSGVNVYPGEEIAFNVTTAATTSGAIIPLILSADEDPEVVGNNSALVASA